MVRLFWSSTNNSQLVSLGQSSALVKTAESCFPPPLHSSLRSSVTVVTGLPPTHLPALNFEGEECELLSSQTHPSQSRLPLPEPSPDTHLVAANNTDGN